MTTSGLIKKPQSKSELRISASPSTHLGMLTSSSVQQITVNYTCAEARPSAGICYVTQKEKHIFYNISTYSCKLWQFVSPERAVHTSPPPSQAPVSSFVCVVIRGNTVMILLCRGKSTHENWKYWISLFLWCWRHSRSSFALKCGYSPFQ